MAGVRAKVPSSRFHCTRSAVTCRAVCVANLQPWQTFSEGVAGQVLY